MHIYSVIVLFIIAGAILVAGKKNGILAVLPFHEH
jgi:hypothetical protein